MEDLRNRPTRIDTATGHPWGIQYGPVFLGVSTRKRDDDSPPGVFVRRAANLLAISLTVGMVVGISDVLINSPGRAARADSGLVTGL